MKRPGDQGEPPPGGRAAERLREHLRDRFGPDADLPEGVPPEPDDDPLADEEPAERDPRDREPPSKKGPDERSRPEDD